MKECNFEETKIAKEKYKNTKAKGLKGRKIKNYFENYIKLLTSKIDSTCIFLCILKVCRVYPLTN